MVAAPMTETRHVEAARKAFAEVTGVLEVATMVEAEPQTAAARPAAGQSCDRLIALLETTVARLQRLRRRLG